MPKRSGFFEQPAPQYLIHPEDIDATTCDRVIVPGMTLSVDSYVRRLKVHHAVMDAWSQAR